MKRQILRKTLAVAVVGSLWLGLTAQAQNSTSASTGTPQLPYGVPQILQLQQAHVGDDTIISYIRSSGNSYNLNADQIVYLQQQGLSSAVINAMLSQPRAGLLPSATSIPMPATAAPPVYQSLPTEDFQSPPQDSIVGPSVTAIDPTAAAAASYSYYQPYYYPAYTYAYPYCYPAGGCYGYYPGVTLSFGPGVYWGGRWGGGWHGGYSGHPYGGVVVGAHGGFGGGGWHGGGGGFHGGGRAGGHR